MLLDALLIVVLVTLPLLLGQRSTNKRMEELMSQFTEVQELVTAMNTATNAIAARIDKLIARIGDVGMTAEEATTVKTELSELSGHLQALGADPENPVPTPAP